MKHNVIQLANYQEPRSFDYTAFNRRAELRFRSAQIRFWIAAAVDALATLAITGCTVFCCYIALTML